ncbi:MAG: nucleoside-diphosphate kinase [Candidatus Thorarchaeota archaeon]
MVRERTLLIVKPDGLRRGLVGRILSRFEDAGLLLAGMKMVKADESLLAKHYEEHIGKDFYPSLIEFMMSNPVIAFVLEGEGAISACRKLTGATNPANAAPGTIRGDFAHALPNGQNLIHASANTEDAEREVPLWFNDQELFSFQRADHEHTHG